MAEDNARRESDALLARFEALGARRIEADILQPAELLLDLYGEDIRGRAYVTQDPLRGEQMLRPDFTVPVVRMHMETRAAPARYTYAGPVFRRQESVADRPSEYPQVGFEVFDETTPRAEVEAELFAAFHAALADLPLRVVTGDMAILRAAVDALETTAHRRQALRRHVFRPERFRKLLDRFSAPAPGPQDPESGPEIGLRSAREVAERRARMEADMVAARLDPAARDWLERLMRVSGAAPDAVETLRTLAADVPAVATHVDGLAERLEALKAVGIDVAALDFEVTYGRTAMEYYDGFVFGFTADGMAPVATGGRYDALTRALGEGRSVPALGGVIRPDLVAALRGI